MTEKQYYPAGAVRYLKNNLPDGQIFSQYGWGGYLIWKLPEKKVFIDGRMCTWSWQSPAGESSNIMEDDDAILLGNVDYRKTFNQYQIKTVLWPKNVSDDLFKKVADKIERLFMKEKEKSFNFIEQIQKDGWQKVYEDPVAVIYRVI